MVRVIQVTSQRTSLFIFLIGYLCLPSVYTSESMNFLQHLSYSSPSFFQMKCNMCTTFVSLKGYSSSSIKQKLDHCLPFFTKPILLSYMTMRLLNPLCASSICLPNRFRDHTFIVLDVSYLNQKKFLLVHIAS